MLHTSVPAPADQPSVAREKRRTNGDASLIKAKPSLFESYCQHLFMESDIRGRLQA
jgi:hypothetical protein